MSFNSIEALYRLGWNHDDTEQRKLADEVLKDLYFLYLMLSKLKIEKTAKGNEKITLRCGRPAIYQSQDKDFYKIKERIRKHGS